jgi:hypothetical protein
MKKYSKTIVIALIILGLLTFYVCFLAPYNLRGVYFANGLGTLDNSIENIGGLYEYFNGYSINNVKYLGSNTYEVYTDKGDFIIIADYSDRMYWRYKVFKLETNIEYFTNPM